MDKLLQAVKDAMVVAQNLCSTMQNAVTYANNTTNEAEEKIKAAADKEASLEAKERDLNVREAKISKVENIVKIDEDGRAMAKQNKETSIKFEAKEQAFKDEMTKKLKELTVLTQKAADDRVMLDKEYAALRKEQADFKIAKENMKDDILKELKALK